MITVEYCDIDLMAILIIGNIHTIIQYYIHEYSYWCFTLWHYSNSVLLCQFMDDYMSRDIHYLLGKILTMLTKLVGCTICIGRLILHELGKTWGAIIFNKIKNILWAFVRKKMRQKSATKIHGLFLLIKSEVRQRKTCSFSQVLMPLKF